MNLKYFPSILVILLISGFLNAQQEEDNAVFLSLTKEFQLNEDGSTDFHYIQELKLLTHNAFHRQYGETFILLNPEYQHLQINDAFTVMADGKVVKSPPNAFNEVLPRFATDAPAYNHLREMVVTHTALEVNAVIHLDYTIHTSENYYPALMGNEILTEDSPVREMFFIIRVPLSIDLYYKALQIRTAPEITEEGGFRIYKWTFHNLHANSHDPFQQADRGHLPRILFSTARDLYQALSFVTNQDAFQYRINMQMDNQVKEISAKYDNETEKILALQDMVVNGLNLYPVPVEQCGFRVRKATDTWQSNGGTELEKCILLTALLMKADIDATPVAVVPAAFYDKGLGSLFVIKNFLVAAKTKEGVMYYLSASRTHPQNLLYDLQGDVAMIMDPNIESIYAYTPEPAITGIKIKGTFKAEDDDMKGDITLELEGKANPYFELMVDDGKTKELLQPSISSGEIDAQELILLNETSSVIRYQVNMDNRLTEHEGYFFLSIPFINAGISGWNMNYLLEKRETPLELPFPVDEEYRYTFTLPAGLIPVSELKDLHLSNSAGEITIGFRHSGDKIEVHRTIRLPEKKISLSQYKEMRMLINVWNDVWENTMVFKKK